MRCCMSSSMGILGLAGGALVLVGVQRLLGQWVEEGALVDVEGFERRFDADRCAEALHRAGERFDALGRGGGGQ